MFKVQRDIYHNYAYKSVNSTPIVHNKTVFMF